ncbi:hypothetical protein BGZ96_007016 [Linnemannia gamsii]|uniref:BTB domain-containing protein n=1 Tax=Linnemannia gamsii TaxID=64522 RepID=A0ABQ7K3E7_9FUNG|nr:hypothetical protein BGZ96_007016 [Linnemannia gamsii]
MRTAELIALLRSHDRNKLTVRDHLAMFDKTRQLHLLGELSNWLLVELHKYQDRQTGPNDLETLQQGSIHSQIRHTLKAIITVLQIVTATTVTTDANGRTSGAITTYNRKGAASNSPTDAKKKTAVPLDDRGKEKILDNFLTPILIGTAPLGPRVDSMDVQLMCAKILCLCTNPLTTNSPFPPQDFTRRMMSISPSNSITRLDSQPSSTKQRRSGGADVVLALSSLLRSSSIKLQEYGLRILTSQKFIVQEKLAWEILPSLRSVLEELKKDLSTILAGSMSLFQADVDIGDVLENPRDGAGTSNGQGGGGGPNKSDESSPVGIRSRGVLLLQSFLQEAGRHTTSTLLLQQSQGPIKLARLQEAAPVSLLIGLWRELQEIFFLDKAALPSCDRLVLVLCGAIYWTCWIFKERESAMVVLLEEGMDTLLAWYGYYITSHYDDDDDHDHEHDNKDKAIPTRVLAQDNSAARKEAVLKHQASVLEYLTKLMANLVSNKNHHAALYSGYPRPVGLTIMRRTIEFFDDIPTTSATLATAGVATTNLESLPLPNSNVDINTTINNSTAVQLIRLKPGILEAMLRVVSGCFGANKASEDLIVYSRVPNVLVMLLSEPVIRDLFGTPSKELPEAMSRRFLHLTLTLLPGFLKHDGVNAWIEKATWNEWTVGYTALVECIMRPLDQEAETVRSCIMDAHKARIANDNPSTPGLTPDTEMGLKALKVFALFWKCHPKGRSLLADLLGPRFFHFRMLYVLTDLRDDDFITTGAGEMTTTTVGGAKWIQERTLLLVDTAVYFGAESNIRFNMRERWSALPFLVALLGSCVRRLNMRGYSLRETHCRRIAQRCFYALRNFWLDRQGLIQLVDLDLGAIGGEAEIMWWKCMPSVIKPYSAATAPGASITLASIVPLLLSILAPPKTEWSSDLLLGGIGRRSQWWHPLFEREDSILVEASLLLAQIAPLPTCQQRLVSKPGVIWILSRMMVERSLVGAISASTRHHRDRRNKADAGAIGGEANVPQELIEKSLFETLSKVMTSEESAKAVVSNNSITELFAAVLEIDQPFRFYRDKTIFEQPESATKEHAEEHEGVELMEEEPAVKEEEAQDNQVPPPELLRPLDLILPTRRHQQLHQQLLRHFQTVMLSLRGQFERIYQYVGGRQGLVGADESADSVYWLREYCAIVFMYTLDPPGASGAPPPPWVAWGSKIDKTALLESESILGVVCRMLTLEMEYDDDGEGVDGEQVGEVMKDSAGGESEVDMKNVQKEEALLRRLSSGLAFQSLGWPHTERWRKQHLQLAETYSEVMTKEWESHVANLDGATTTTADKGKGHPVPISFLVQGRTITFPDRMCLSRASPFFYTLLLGDFRESNQQQIVLQDVEPDDIELLLEILRESRMTAQHLLPEDMPFEMVIRLMVCADRYMVGFVKRLAEVWILQTLGELELKWYDLHPTKRTDAGKGGTAGLQATVLDGTKRLRNDDGLLGGSVVGVSLGVGVGVGEKRPRLDPNGDIDLINGVNRTIAGVITHMDLDPQKQIAPTDDDIDLASIHDNNNNNNNNNNSRSSSSNSSNNNDDDDSGSSEGKQSPRSPICAIQTGEEGNDDEGLMIQDCLLMVYEVCSHPRLGSIYSSTHPFHALVWDVLRRIMLRLGSIAVTPRFATMLNQGGEERIQEFLQILYELATDETDSYLVE